MVMLASIFRDSESYLDRYFDQIRALRDLIPVDIHLAEGDSTDGTYDLLDARLAPGDTLIQVNHGGPTFGSVDHPQRWHQIATVCNALFDKLPFGEPLVYVESDLIWDPPTMCSLLADLSRVGVDAVAPQSLANHGRRFYDTWGYRWPTGEMFTSDPIDPTSGLAPIASAGSCIAMRPAVYRDCRFGENDGIVGLGRAITVAGFGMWLDPALSVEHP